MKKKISQHYRNEEEEDQCLFVCLSSSTFTVFAFKSRGRDPVWCFESIPSSLSSSFRLSLIAETCFFPSNSFNWPTAHSSMASTMNRTSLPFFCLVSKTRWREPHSFRIKVTFTTWRNFIHPQHPRAMIFFQQYPQPKEPRNWSKRRQTQPSNLKLNNASKHHKILSSTNNFTFH